MYRQLQAAFPGQVVRVVDYSKDRNVLVLSVSSDRDPGTWYVFDRKARKAAPVTRRFPWIEPKTQASQRSVELASRDGKRLHGVLTLPPGFHREGPAAGSAPARRPLLGPRQQGLRRREPDPGAARLCGAAGELPRFQRLWARLP